MGGTSCEQFERMGEDIDHGFEGLDGALGRPGDIENEAATDSAGDATREAPEGTDGAHGFGQAGSLAFDHGAGRFRGQVGGGEPGAARRHHQPSERGGQVSQRGGDRIYPIGSDPPLHDSKAMGDQCGRELLPGAVFPGAVADGLRNGQYLGFECHFSDATPGGRFTRIMATGTDEAMVRKLGLPK
jgi:hypothetical protein